MKIRVVDLDPAGHERLDAVLRFERAVDGGLTTSEAALVVGRPRSSLMRWRKRCREDGAEALRSKSRRPKRLRKPADYSKLRVRITELREEYPTWGKEKLTKLLSQEGFTASESTVGRCISGLVQRGALACAQAVTRRAGRRLRKPKRPYATRLKRHQRLRATQPGEVVQIDHMTVSITAGKVVKHFNAICIVSRWLEAEVFTSASAQCATTFLEQLIKNAPFDIQAIQVDGGSEFMAEFEQACEKHGIELAVLAPKSPEMNGTVERVNGTLRAEFYDLYDLPHRLDELRPLVQDAKDTYNWDRPHHSLALQTPHEFLQTLLQAA